MDHFLTHTTKIYPETLEKPLTVIKNGQRQKDELNGWHHRKLGGSHIGLREGITSKPTKKSYRMPP